MGKPVVLLLVFAIFALLLVPMVAVPFLQIPFVFSLLLSIASLL